MKKDANQPKDKKRPPARQQSIVGGPVVVELADKRRDDRLRSIFVAVAKGPSRFGEYLSDCVVYELDSGGKPLAMVRTFRAWSKADGIGCRRMASSGRARAGHSPR